MADEKIQEMTGDLVAYGRLSPAEEKFERWRRSVGLFLGPLVAAVIYVVPLSLQPKAHTLAAILGLVVTWWMTEPIPIPVTALLGVVLCIVAGIAPALQALGPFADPTIFLFLGSFILARAMAVHRLDRRFAYGIMSLSWVGGSTFRLLFVYGLIAAFTSMWISNTATTAMMFPIGLGIVGAMGDMIGGKDGKRPAHLRFGTGMMLMTAYAASAGGIGTPIGTPPNLIGIAIIEKSVGVKIHFFQWMALAVPCLVVMYLFLFVLLYRLEKPEVSTILGAQEYVKGELSKLGAWTRGEKNTLFVFGLAVSLWVLPGFLAFIYGATSVQLKAFNSRVPEAVVAVICAALLFLLPVDWSKRTFTLTWDEASRIDWGTLLLFGGGISLGNLMFGTGLAEDIGKGLLQLTGAGSVAGITFAAILVAILVSEATSNTASANMIVPVMISLTMAAGLNPIAPAVGATLGASWGFMLPVSTPPNAIVYGSGMVPITRMIRAGFLFDLVGAVTIWATVMLLLPLVGLG